MSDTSKVTGSPDVIYLVYGELEHDDTHDNLVDESGGEVTWCPIPQFQSDVCYARMDILMEALKECAELRPDALRYRFLRSLWKKDHFTTESQPDGDPEYCDKYIDAAMK